MVAWRSPLVVVAWGLYTIVFGVDEIYAGSSEDSEISNLKFQISNGFRYGARFRR